MKTGPWIGIHKDGGISSLIHYEKGIPDGFAMIYGKDGKISLKIHFHRDTPDKAFLIKKDKNGAEILKEIDAKIAHDFF